MILYIHGFGSSGQSYKARVLKKHFKDAGFLSPSLSYVPKLAINTLEEIIESYQKHDKIYLMGSSLGGYYSIYLADKYNLPAIIINPAVNPTETLKEFGLKNNYYDNSKFECTKEHLDSLKIFEVKDVKNELYFLLSKKGDEVLDYKEAKKMFENSKSIIEDGGDHSFDDIAKHIKAMEVFLQNY